MNQQIAEEAVKYARQATNRARSNYDFVCDQPGTTEEEVKRRDLTYEACQLLLGLAETHRNSLVTKTRKGCAYCGDSTESIAEVHDEEGAHPRCEGCGEPLYDQWYSWNTPGPTRVCSEACYTQVTGQLYLDEYRFEEE